MKTAAEIAAEICHPWPETREDMEKYIAAAITAAREEGRAYVLRLLYGACCVSCRDVMHLGPCGNKHHRACFEALATPAETKKETP